MAGAYLGLALAMIFVGANIAVGKAIVAVLPVFLFGVLRSLIALSVLIPVTLAVEGPPRRLRRPELLALVLQAFFGMFLFTVFMMYGVRLTSAVSAGVITSTIPAAIALLSFLALGERLGRRRALAILLAVLGIAAVNLGAAEEAGGGRLMGNLLVLGAVFAEASFTVLAKRLTAAMGPLQLSTGVNLVSLCLFLPPALVELRGFDLGTVPWLVWGEVVFYALTASVLSFILWYRGVARVDANLAGVFTSLMPLAAAAVGILWLGERPALAHLLGLMAVLAAIWLGTREAAPRAPLQRAG